MISLSSIRKQWCSPAWAVLLVVCVLFKSFTVSVASVHVDESLGTEAGFVAQVDSTLGDDDSKVGDEGSDPFHRLLHANHCCLSDGLAVGFAHALVVIAYSHSPPTTVTLGRPAAHHGPLLRPPRLA